MGKTDGHCGRDRCTDPLGWSCSQEIGYHSSSERVSANRPPPALAPILISCLLWLLYHLSLGANGWPCPGLAPAMKPTAQNTYQVAKEVQSHHILPEMGSRSLSTPSASPPRAWPSLYMPVSITPSETCDQCNQLYSQTKQLQLNSEKSRPVVSRADPPPSCLLPTCSQVHEDAGVPAPKWERSPLSGPQPLEEEPFFSQKLSRVTLELLKFVCR